MPNNLRIALVPLDIAWADRDENLINVEAILRGMDRQVDLVVLPELFSTGFIQDEAVLPDIAESMAGPTLAAVHKWTRDFNCAVAGSFMLRSGSRYYNRAFFIEPSGDEFFYDKRHLFSLSSEADIFTPGDRHPFVVRFRGWNISMIVCYDLRFPVWCRNAAHSYDLMLVPANWASSREYAWKHLLIARGIENQAYYAGANRSGADDHGTYSDTAMVVDGLGKPIARKDESTGILYADLSKDILEQQRRKFPFGKDADSFECQI